MNGPINQSAREYFCAYFGARACWLLACLRTESFEVFVRPSVRPSGRPQPASEHTTQRRQIPTWRGRQAHIHVPSQPRSHSRSHSRAQPKRPSPAQCAPKTQMRIHSFIHSEWMHGFRPGWAGLGLFHCDRRRRLTDSLTAHERTNERTNEPMSLNIRIFESSEQPAVPSCMHACIHSASERKGPDGTERGRGAGQALLK